MGNASNDAQLPDDPQEGQSEEIVGNDNPAKRPARPSFRDRVNASQSPSGDGPVAGGEGDSKPLTNRPSRLTPPTPSGEAKKSDTSQGDDSKPKRVSFSDRLAAGGAAQPARPQRAIPSAPVGDSQAKADSAAPKPQSTAKTESDKPARPSFRDRLGDKQPPAGTSQTHESEGEDAAPANPELDASEPSAPATPAERPERVRPATPPPPAREKPAPRPFQITSPVRQVSAIDQERLNRLTSLQSQGGAVSTSFQNMVQGMRNKNAAASRSTTTRAAAPDVSIENKPDYVDILSHLDARTKLHPEYQEVLEQYGPRLFTGGEVLSGALLGLNAGLMDTVHRRLSMNGRFPLYIDFKEVALTPILVVTENGHQTEVELNTDSQKPTIIGRGNDCTKQLQAQFVSRHHVSIRNKSTESEPPMWVIEDLQSTHGTTLNDTQLIGKDTLKPGDVVKLGSSFGAPDHPKLEILYRAKNYSREALDQLLARVDIVVAVAQADHMFEGQKVFINNLNSLQNNGALVVIAVSRSKAIDEEDIEINVDDLRQAANVRLGRKTRRHLTAVHEKSMGESEWTDEIFDFIDSFKELALEDVVQQRRKNTRKEVVTAITRIGTRIQPSIKAALEEAQRKRARVEDEMTGAPRALQSGDALREDSFKELKQVIEDACKDFSNDIKPDSLTYLVTKMIASAPYVTRKGAKLSIELVVPGTVAQGAVASNQQVQAPHPWLLHHMREYARIQFAKLRSDVVGKNSSPPGVGYIMLELRTGLAANDKVRDQNLFDSERYLKYDVPELGRRMEQRIASDFVEAQAATSEKIDNMFTFMLTKTRFAIMFYLSIFSIIGIIGGFNGRSELKNFLIRIPDAVKYPVGIAIIGLLGYLNYKTYKSSVQDKVEEEVLKLRDKATKHYQEAAKVVIDDCKRELIKHITEQETNVKRTMGTLGSSRMSESMMQRNNPALDAARAECDLVESQLVMIDQEREWAKQAESVYFESPFYEDPNAARPPRRLGSRLR